VVRVHVRAVQEHHSDIRIAEDIPANPRDAEVVTVRGERIANQARCLTRLHVEKPNIVLPHAARQSPASNHGDRNAFFREPDATAEEEKHVVAAGLTASQIGRRRHRAERRLKLRHPRVRGRAEAKDAGVFEKKVTLFRKQQAEAGQVDLLDIRFYLREVGVQGEVQAESASDGELGIEPAIEMRARCHVGVLQNVAFGIGCDFDVPLPL